MTTPDLSLPHAAPERSLAQRMDALQRANDTRYYRARLKERMKAGEVSPVEVLSAPPVLVETMRVWDLLLAVPKHGRVKTNKLLGQVKISPSKTVGGLSEHQRGELCALLSGRSPRPTVTYPSTLL